MITLVLLLKAGLGACLFVFILWCAQSRHPRAAGMMLTFPALNGIGMLAGDASSWRPMVQAMMPMIGINGLLCVGYIVALRRLRCPGKPVDSYRVAMMLMALCLFLWFLTAGFVTPHLQVWLTSSRRVVVFIFVYLFCAFSCAVLMWCPAQDTAKNKLNLWGVFQAHKERIAILFGLIILVQYLVRIGEPAWAGRLSAFPLLPCYTLALLYVGETSTTGHASVLDQLGSTTLMGPAVAMLFVWGYRVYLQSLLDATENFTYMLGGVFGLLLGWSLCGLLIWSIVYLMAVVERRRNTSTCSIC